MIVSFGNKNKSPAFPSAFPSLRFLRCVFFAAVSFAQWLKSGGAGSVLGGPRGGNVRRQRQR